MLKNKIELYIPKLEDFWYEEKVKSNPKTMKYNAGYDVSYPGYHYDTGCIDFPKERWQATYNKRIKENCFLAYIKDVETDKFIGYVDYHYNKEENRYECGVLVEYPYLGKGYGKSALKLLCKTAASYGIKELYDGFEIDRGYTLSLFQSLGFEIYEYKTWKKFGKDVKGVIVRIKL